MPAFVGTRRALLGGGADTFNGNPYSFYSLLDIFSDTRAAGSVNGTLPVVGGARVVTDTNSRMSITGGKLSAAAGAAIASDFYPNITRALGITLLGVVNSDVNGVRLEYGSNASFIKVIASLINVRDGGGTGVDVATITQGVDYSVAMVLRALGQYYFYKPTGGNWTLIWSGKVDSSTRAPGVTFQANTVGIADNVRVPVALYIPTPLAYDTFTRADAALGNSETSGPDAQTTPALAWTGTTYTISTNKAINTPTLGADVIVNGGFGADTDWTKGAGWTIGAGTAVATAASSDLTAAVAPLTTGTWYQTAFTQGGFAAGTVNVKLGTTAFPTHGANGTFTETGRATSTAFAMTGAGLTDTVDNVSAKSLTLSELFASLSVSTPNVLADVSVTLVSATDGKQAGLVLNLDSAATPANFVIAYLDGNGNAKLDKCVAGTYTNVISAAVTYSAGAVLRVSKSGTSYRLFYNNLAVGVVSTISDAGIISNTLHGLFSTSPVNSLDVFQLFPIGVNNEYSGLDVF